MKGREPAKRRWRRALCVAVALVNVCVAPASASVETEIEEGLGRVLAEAFCKQRGVLRQPLLQQWVEEIGRQVAAESPRQELHYHFTVLDSPEANAFALPGGYVFVTAGLLETLTGDDELATIIAHELGHLANRDFQRTLERQLVFLAVGAILEHKDQRGLVNLTRAAQLLNGLHQSREHEAQADALAVRLTTGAGYDARGMIHFLSRAGGGSWSYLEMVLSTHPHPTKRIGWIQGQLAELRARQPEEVLEVAEGLAGRARYSVAIEVLRGLEGEEAQAAGRETLLGEIALAQGEGAAAQRHFEAALRRAPEHDRALAGQARAGEMQPSPQVRWEGVPEEQAAGLEQARVEVLGDQGAARDASRAAWRHLRRLWRNRQVAQALTMAQAFDPELLDPGYLYLVAKATDMLNQVLQGSNLVGHTLNLRSRVVRGLAKLSEELATARPGTEQGAGVLLKLAEELPMTGPRAAKQSAEAAVGLERIARGYERSTASLAPILLELLAAGEGDPLGRLTFSRFAVLEAQVALNERRIRRLHREGWEAARLAWAADLELRRMRLSLLGAAAAPAGRQICLRLIGRRLRESEEAVAARWESTGALGDAALALAREALGLPAGQAADTEGFSGKLRALRLMLRILELEVSAEQVRRK